jgi:hypothetical protein
MALVKTCMADNSTSAFHSPVAVGEIVDTAPVPVVVCWVRREG